MPDSPIAVVTCGPAYEPIDSVRRITNHSTGEIGVFLSDALAARGFQVVCFRGEMASHPAPASARVYPFTTNDSLEVLFDALPKAPAAIFHAAALGDYRVSSVEGGRVTNKIRSDLKELVIHLTPAPKLLPLLPEKFPHALIVGWKYELDGNRDDALERGRRQIATVGTVASVVNGHAYGEGFGLLEGGEVTHFADKQALSAHLAEWSWRRIALKA